MSRHLNRMIYIDDSGHPPSGMVVYGWIEFSPDHWGSVLRCWLDSRKMLWREYRVAIQQELQHHRLREWSRPHLQKHP